MSEETAKAFHDAYERLAPSFGYSTRRESAVPWEEVPENNRRLMIAVTDEVVGGLQAHVESLMRPEKTLMLLGDLDKPFHRSECQCERCIEWLRANRVALQTKVERLQAIVDGAMLWRMDEIHHGHEAEYKEIDRVEHLAQMRIILDEYRRTCEATEAAEEARSDN